MPSRADVIQCARKYLETPFSQRGRQISKGIDCIGVVLCVGTDLNISDKDGNPFHPLLYKDYPNQPFGDEVQEECKKRLIIKSIGTPTSFSQIIPGDIVTMRIPPETAFRKLFVKDEKLTPITHVAIITDLNGALGVIHSYNSDSVRRKVVEHLIDLRWMRRIAGVFSFPGVTD
jgi:hypothetical protein